MNENEKVKTGLLYCASSKDAPAGACPYGKNCEECDGIQRLKAEALAAIIRLEAEAKRLKADNTQLQVAFDAMSRDVGRFKAERDAALDEYQQALVDMKLVGETNNACLVCGYYHPERTGDRKCDLMGTHCAWMWDKLQRSDYMRGIEDVKGKHTDKDY